MKVSISVKSVDHVFGFGEAQGGQDCVDCLGCVVFVYCASSSHPVDIRHRILIYLGICATLATTVFQFEYC